MLDEISVGSDCDTTSTATWCPNRAQPTLIISRAKYIQQIEADSRHWSAYRKKIVIRASPEHVPRRSQHLLCSSHRGPNYNQADRRSTSLSKGKTKGTRH